MKPSRVLVTGGAGFIGSNLVNRLIGEGHSVTIFDNLSRSGCTTNLEWLETTHGKGSFDLIKANITDFEKLKKAATGMECIFHLAGQVAVTTSTKNPRQDFEDNALGTFNALEAARLVANDPIFIFASTNKVYGGLETTRNIEEGTRYRFVDLPFGVPETQPLDFHSPYGCSKGTGDQYTHDYSRIYGLRTVIMRQSCIYGYRQFGVEDQGWVAWFIIAAIKGRPISIYGNGKQVRDILFIEDLLEAYELAANNISTSAGQIYNLGGGPENTISIWAEFGPIIEEITGKKISVTWGDWRPGDQPIYISDIRKAQRDLGWKPQISACDGIRRLYQWINEHQELFNHL